MTISKCKPFVKWVGGKTQLLKTYEPILGETWELFSGAYIEPFAGSAAIFFSGKFPVEDRLTILCDVNAHLMNAYVCVRDVVDEVIYYLRQHQYLHCAEYYYKERSLGLTDGSKVECAARFIYLNKAGFNGLYRVNKKGEFNVPIGTNKRILDTDVLLSCSKRLKYTILVTGSYERAFGALLNLRNFDAGDFVFLDPPYVKVKADSFTAYSADGFGEKDHRRLCQYTKNIASTGASVALANSDTDFVRELYKDFDIHEVTALRSVNSDGKNRKGYQELLITANV